MRNREEVERPPDADAQQREAAWRNIVRRKFHAYGAVVLYREQTGGGYPDTASVKSGGGHQRGGYVPGIALDFMQVEIRLKDPTTAPIIRSIVSLKYYKEANGHYLTAEELVRQLHGYRYLDLEQIKFLADIWTDAERSFEYWFARDIGLIEKDGTLRDEWE